MSQQADLPWLKQTATITLKPATFVSAALVLLVCWTCIFLLGVMAGRDNANSRPHKQIENSVARAPASGSTEMTPENQAIIDATDLRYQFTLKKGGLIDRLEQGKNTLVAQILPQLAPEKPKPKEKEPKEEAASPTKAEGAGTQADAGRMYDYIYQIGTFRESDEASIDRLRERLEGAGYRTRMQRSGSLRILFLVGRATSAIEEEVPAITRNFKLGPPLLRQKEPVQ
jgi:hypothetical protein